MPITAATLTAWIDEIRVATNSDKDADGIIAEAVYRYRHQVVTGTPQQAMWQPIYTAVYVQGTPDELGAIKAEDRGGNVTYLRPATQDELARAVYGSDIRHDPSTGAAIYPTLLYVEVQHRLEYPFAAVDFTEIIDRNDPLETLFSDTPRPPKQFCRAAIVATPQFAII